MKTIYRADGTFGHSILVGEEIPFGWHDSKEVAEEEFKKLQERRGIEHLELLSQASEILEQKRQQLLGAIGNLGCDVRTRAVAQDGTGLGSWLTLEIALTGKHGTYPYSTYIRL